MRTIIVTCAIITLEGKTLVVQRSETMRLPLKWEFPGGKVEFGETDEESIVREIKEELNIEIKLLGRLKQSDHRYPNFTVNLIPFLAEYLRGEIKLLEHKQCLLLHKHELATLDWAEADIPIVKEYLEI